MNGSFHGRILSKRAADGAIAAEEAAGCRPGAAGMNGLAPSVSADSPRYRQ
ncbi:MAG: hypothetical protein IKI03_02910 [Clostridia bacterium]|nr:hypothetical protein [Clostridia bacterium]